MTEEEEKYFRDRISNEAKAIADEMDDSFLVLYILTAWDNTDFLRIDAGGKFLLVSGKNTSKNTLPYKSMAFTKTNAKIIYKLLKDLFEENHGS